MSSPSPTNPFKLGDSVPSSVPGAKPPSPSLPKRLDVPKLPSANRGASGMPGQVTPKNNPGSLADPDFTKKAMEPGSSYKSMFSDVRAKSADLQATHAAERAATPPPSRVADFARGAGGAGGIAPKAASNLAGPAAGGAAPIAGLLLAPEGAVATAGATAGASAATPMMSLGSSGLGAASSAASTAAAAAAQQPPKPATAEELLAKGLSSAEEAPLDAAAAAPPEAAPPSLLDSLSDGAGAGGGGGSPEDPESMGALLDSLMGPMPTE